MNSLTIEGSGEVYSEEVTKYPFQTIGSVPTENPVSVEEEGEDRPLSYRISEFTSPFYTAFKVPTSKSPPRSDLSKEMLDGADLVPDISVGGALRDSQENGTHLIHDMYEEDWYDMRRIWYSWTGGAIRDGRC
ncbi:unnamed protein product [Clonostachys solani]|uniref:Uncharacterized protein n=1 Tax=Clonostachys solani TaxID=160281 RepID=A0A9N9ZIA3_9HYPO|nr:unnamed protein product [Clonostachys solani]